jgi:hypothetical protein
MAYVPQDRTETIVYRCPVGQIGTRYAVAEVLAVTDTDTVTFDCMNVISNALATRLDTGTTLSLNFTETDNIVTINTSVTDVPVVIFVFGY